MEAAYKTVYQTAYFHQLQYGSYLAGMVSSHQPSDHHSSYNNSVLDVTSYEPAT